MRTQSEHHPNCQRCDREIFSDEFCLYSPGGELVCSSCATENESETWTDMLGSDVTYSWKSSFINLDDRRNDF